MTNVIYYLAASEGGEGLPLEKSVNPLLPASYDVVWSAVSLIVVLFLFWKFVLPKFQEVLTEREDRIKGGIQRAEAAQAEAKAALEKYNAQLAEARAEAAQIREEAREKGKQIVADMKAQATEESNRIIESGEKQLQAQREQVVRWDRTRSTWPNASSGSNSPTMSNARERSMLSCPILTLWPQQESERHARSEPRSTCECNFEPRQHPVWH